LPWTETFDNNLTQGFFVAEALDHIQNLYARQLSVPIVVRGNPLGQVLVVTVFSRNVMLSASTYGL